MKAIKFFAIPMLVLALFASCSDDDDNPPPVNEEELITNVTLTFTNTADATDIVVMTSVAPNGQDGASTEAVNGNFTSGATYALTLSILNATETPADDVLNDDIIPEADEHFFSYAINGVNFTMSRDAGDVDGPSGSKLGVNTTWVAGAASTGNLQIVLTHEPVTVDDSDNFGSATGGSEDFNITFTGVIIN